MPAYSDDIPDDAPSIPADMLTAAHALVLKWALRRVDYDTANDLASIVALNVWERTQIDPALLKGHIEFERFVYAAARNALVDRLRSDRRRAQREAVFATSYRDREHLWMCPEDEVLYTELADAYRSALDATTARLRAAYIMVELEEMSHSDVAARLNVSPRAVESRLRRTRMELRQQLAEYHASAETPRARTRRREAA